MARLLLRSWADSLERGAAMPAAIDGAFAPGVRLHLLDAYGWFLLATIRVSQLPERPPHHTSGLPALKQGLAIPGEVDEYRQLEANGWIRQLQTPLPVGMPKRSVGAVLAVANAYPQLSDFEDWCSQFEHLFTRMADSLDEY
jgi:hypothetical protein